MKKAVVQYIEKSNKYLFYHRKKKILLTRSHGLQHACVLLFHTRMKRLLELSLLFTDYNILKED